MGQERLAVLHAILAAILRQLLSLGQLLAPRRSAQPLVSPMASGGPPPASFPIVDEEDPVPPVPSAEQPAERAEGRSEAFVVRNVAAFHLGHPSIYYSMALNEGVT